MRCAVSCSYASTTMSSAARTRAAWPVNGVTGQRSHHPFTKAITTDNTGRAVGVFLTHEGSAFSHAFLLSWLRASCTESIRDILQ